MHLRTQSCRLFPTDDLLVALDMQPRHHPRPHMHQHVTMHHPHAGIIRPHPNHHVPPPRHADCILAHGVDEVRRHEGPRLKGVVAAPSAAAFGSKRRQDVERVSVQMDRVCPIIQIINNNVDVPRLRRINKRDELVRVPEAAVCSEKRWILRLPGGVVDEAHGPVLQAGEHLHFKVQDHCLLGLGGQNFCWRGGRESREVAVLAVIRRENRRAIFLPALETGGKEVEAVVWVQGRIGKPAKVPVPRLVSKAIDVAFRGWEAAYSSSSSTCSR